MEPHTASVKDLPRVLERLLRATNRHDLAELAACFAANYVNQTPAHPERGFTGRDQVRRNWEQLFTAIPDLTASINSVAVDGKSIWSEWHLSGTRRDGARHEMAGVIIFTVRVGEILAARFYLEPVERDSGTVNDAVHAAVTAP